MFYSEFKKIYKLLMYRRISNSRETLVNVRQFVRTVWTTAKNYNSDILLQNDSRSWWYHFKNICLTFAYLSQMPIFNFQKRFNWCRWNCGNTYMHYLLWWFNEKKNWVVVEYWYLQKPYYRMFMKFKMYKLGTSLHSS